LETEANDKGIEHEVEELDDHDLLRYKKRSDRKSKHLTLFEKLEGEEVMD
jgi:hypothetical protein